ncbi:response regulator [Diaphorobacter aerolatus]|uniref:Response regulator n=1 Tax=Diaphorobacter aerolatus TaxID=1288495 RepID=A0A7H0GJ14_9BURK|nr:response regulator [Diaphorobacter aerolatus]QNP48280.1 response regulator [Diaphorobacter aerolatus]
MNNNNPRILIVEDEADIANVVVDYLRHAGFDAEHVDNGTAALERLLSAHPPDLTVLDVMLPGVDGLEVLRQTRKTSDALIILLTARVEEVDRLIGLELGADDYICKPFSPREVVARVKTVLRRRKPTASNAPADTGALQLDDNLSQVTLYGKPVPLTHREYRLLQTLIQHRDRILSRAQMLELSYDEDTQDLNERSVDSHIKNLRKKLRSTDRSGHDWIRSVYGVGFAFEPPDSSGQARVSTWEAL